VHFIRQSPLGHSGKKTRDCLKLMQPVLRTGLELRISRFQVQHPNQPTSLDLHEMCMCTSLTTLLWAFQPVENVMPRNAHNQMHADFNMYHEVNYGHDYLPMYSETRKQNYLMTRVKDSQK